MMGPQVQTQTQTKFVCVGRSSSVQFSKAICIVQLSGMSHCALAARKPVRFKFMPETHFECASWDMNQHSSFWFQFYCFKGSIFISANIL